MNNALRDKLEKIKQKGFADNTAQSIFEHLTRLRELASIHKRRWIWELLQNAADAAKGKSSVMISVKDNTLRFSHKGAAFIGEEIFHLIYHGSTKQLDPGKKGKFGSGFLTIHLLSLKVRIKGILNVDNTLKCFDFILDRSGDNFNEIREHMEDAWNSFNNSLKDTEENLEFTTTFECEMENSVMDMVRSGVSDLEKVAPFVLAFVEELEKITLQEQDSIKSWKKGDCENCNGFKLTTVCYDGESQKNLRIVEVGESKEKIALAVLLKKEGAGWAVAGDEATPRLFCPFPLVETHDMPLQVVVVSNKFHPTPERNGIFAHKSGSDSAPQTEDNWKLLNMIPTLFKNMVTIVCKEQWSGVHNLAKIVKSPNKEWLDVDRFDKEVVQKAISRLREHGCPTLCVQTENGKFIHVKDAVIAIGTTSETISRLTRQLKDINGSLPSSILVKEWAKIVENWADVLKIQVEDMEEAFTLKKLTEKVSESKSLSELKERLDLQEGKTEIDWLNQIFELVIQNKSSHLLEAHSLLPNQEGQFKQEGELQLEAESIDETLKDICSRLGEPIRPGLLHKDVSQVCNSLFEKITGRSLSTENCVERALKKVKEHLNDNDGENYIEGNAQLLRWFIERCEKKIQGFPVVCVTGSHELTNKEPSLLKPCRLWDDEVSDFVDLFPDAYIMHDEYAKILEEGHWRFLEEKCFVYPKLFDNETVDTLKQHMVEGDLSEDNEHTLTPAVPISQIVRLDEIINTVRRSQKQARKFLEFILKYIIKIDRSWQHLKEVNCSCGKVHRIYPEWMNLLKTREWVPVGKSKEDKPTPENIAKILNEGLKKTILSNPDCGNFLLKIGIGVSDLLRFSIPEERRFPLDQLSARLYGSSDGVIEGITAILDDPDLGKHVLDKKQEKEKTHRNQRVGKMVEELVKKELEGVGITVERTGVGSDYEIENDFIEGDQEQILKMGHYLVEIKSTSGDHVRMTIPQGEKAVSLEDKDKYVVCIVEVPCDNIDEAVVRDNSRFVFGIGEFLKDKVENAKNLKKMEKELGPRKTEDVEIQIEGSKIRFKLGKQIWEKHGLTFGEFVKRIRPS